MRIIIYIATFLLFFSCHDEKKKTHTYSFYYWKTQLKINPVEAETLEKSTGENFYVRFFDVDKVNGKFQPIAILQKANSFKTHKSIVPVVFITNRSFIGIKPDEVDFLAQSVHLLLKRKIKEFGWNNTQEIQIDCDWTEGTKKDFFTFINLLKEKSKKQITSTLRLHQVKFKNKTGIPPVDKVYLMCYSTSSPLEDTGVNSILDVKILKNYLSLLEDYPIKNIAVALPIYSWGIIENHLGKHKLINALNREDLSHPNFKKINDNEVEVLKDGFYFGFYLNQGFKIKVEEVSQETLKETVRFLEKKINSFPVVYYHLDEKFITHQNLNF